MTHDFIDDALRADLLSMDVPAPRAALKSDILALAKQTPQSLPAANDHGTRVHWLRTKTTWISGLAAAAALALFSTVQTPSLDDDALYAQTASEMGHSELYVWVAADAQDIQGGKPFQLISPALGGPTYYIDPNLDANPHSTAI